MSFKVHHPSKTIEKIANTIGQDLEYITDEIQRNTQAIERHEADSEDEQVELDHMHAAFHSMNDKVNSMLKEVSLLRKQAQENSNQIQMLLGKPPAIERNISTDTVDYNNYKPQHPYFQRAAAQSAARKTYCWLTQSSDDKKNKAKQDKLVQEYYGDKTTDKRREAIIKELMAMAKCKDKCQLQGKAIISAKGCADDDAVRKFVMDKLESSKFINKKLGKKTVLTRRRAKTALKEESSAMSFQA